MPTKGIQFYTYISNPAISVNIQIGSEFTTSFSFIQNPNSNSVASFGIQQGSYEIGSKNAGIFSETFTCQVYQSGNPTPLLTLNQSMSPFTGNIGDSNSDNLCNMFNTPSQIYQGANGSKFAISYGFFDAGPGGLQITNQHQFYIYVTDVYTTWLEDLANAYNQTKVQNIKLCNLVVAGAHDAGMCSTATLAALNSTSSTFQSICSTMGLPFNDAIVPSSTILQTIINLSFTQKDSYTTMLNMGVRFFDFRPGYNCVNVDNSVNHQHWVVPGDSFDNFINEVSSWVAQNKKEIVFIYLNYLGFAESMQPISYLETYLNQTSFNGVNIGGPSCLNNTVGDCYNTNTRIIFLNSLSNTTINNLPNATYLDSYSDDAYQTTDVQSVLQSLNNTIVASKASSNAANCTLYQLQATANAAGGIASGLLSSFSMSAASSILLSTKPQFDYNTYPLLQNAANNGQLSNNCLNVCLNDFVDNALVSNCINMTAFVAGL